MIKARQNNPPIAYDFHGDIPFSVPFRQIAPKDIHIYLDLDTRVGKKTCGQSCAHCWFVNYEKAFDKYFDMNEGRLIKEAIEAKGHKVFARYTDSFALNGDFMRLYGPVHNREFRQEAAHKPTETMAKGDAWTSGAPLMGDNYLELLDLARESGYGTISITFHGILDEALNLRPEIEYPIKGVFSGAKLEEVASRIFRYNADRRAAHPEAGERAFRLNIGVTIGRHNNSREQLARCAEYFNRMGVDTVRFNCFTDHGGRHPHLQMSADEIAQCYRDIKWLHETAALRFQVAVSEDFGTSGIEVMGFPEHVGWCRAGRQLFTVIPSAQQTLSDSASEKAEKIGDIVACVNIFEPHFGVLVRRTNKATNEASYALEFDDAAIDRFTLERVEGVYQDGCFAKEMLKNKRPELHVPAKHVLIFAKTAYAKTPYDQWLAGTGMTPLILTTEEFAPGYRHMGRVYSFADYDRNQLVEKTAYELARKFPLAAVFARAEADVIRASHLRERMGVQGQGVASATAYRNKVTMKDRLRGCGVESPNYRALASAYDALEFVEKHGYPVVIKPTSESGSFGTHIIKNREELEKYLARPFPGEMEIEAFVAGEMYHVDGLIADGRLAFIHPSKYLNDCLSFRKNEYLGSFALSPASPLHPRLIDAAKKVVAALPAARNMAFHAEFWHTPDDRIVFCEIGSRTGGALISSLLSYSFGFNIDREWLLAECGLARPIEMTEIQLGGWVIIPPQSGTLEALPEGAPPSCVQDSHYCGKAGQRFQGGVKSGLFLAGYVVNGSSEQEVVRNMSETAAWFGRNAKWDSRAEVAA